MQVDIRQGRVEKYVKQDKDKDDAPKQSAGPPKAFKRTRPLAAGITAVGKKHAAASDSEDSDEAAAPAISNRQTLSAAALQAHLQSVRIGYEAPTAVDRSQGTRHSTSSVTVCKAWNLQGSERSPGVLTGPSLVLFWVSAVYRPCATSVKLQQLPPAPMTASPFCLFVAQTWELLLYKAQLKTCALSKMQRMQGPIQLIAKARSEFAMGLVTLPVLPCWI